MSVSSFPMLPNKKEERGFNRLVLDRQRAFMVTELLELREGLMGSDALIATAKRSGNVIPRLMSSDYQHLGWAVEPFFRFVSHAGVGDSLHRWAGHLPPVKAFAPNEPLEQHGKMETSSINPITEALKAAPKPDWEGFLVYYEVEGANGRIPPLTGRDRAMWTSATELRRTMQAVLNIYNSSFIETMHLMLYDFRYPYISLECLASNEQEMRRLAEAVEPLPVKAVR